MLKLKFGFVGGPVLVACMAASTPASAGGPQLFVEQANAFAPEACQGTGCWTNHLRVTDLNDDGHLDVLLVNYPDFFFGDDDPEPLVLYVNDGSAGFTNVSATALGGFEGNVRQVAVGDVDDDGDPDIYVPDAIGGAHVLFINDGSGDFTDEADVRLPADFPRAAATRMGDLDGDGWIDIFAADGYAEFNASEFGHVYANDGDGNFTEIMDAVPTTIDGIDIDDVELLDVDRDFDLDIFVNAHNQGLGALWINDGTGSFSAATLPAEPTGNNHYNVAPCDVDGDGDLDLWIENIGTAGGQELLLINDGSGGFTDETAARVTGNNDEDDNGVACVDIDDDGDLDAVVISLTSPERYFRNDGGNFTLVSGAFGSMFDSSLWAEFGDLNADGRIDLVTGQGETTTNDRVYLAEPAVPVDSTAPLIIATEAIEGVVPRDEERVVRFAVSDRTVTDEGPRVVRASVGVDLDVRGFEVEARYIGGDLFRAVLPAQKDGPSVIAYQACAEDRQGNVGCGEWLEYELEDEAGTTGGETEGGSEDTTSGVDSTATSGASTTGETATTAGATATATATTAPAGTDESSGSDGGAADGGDDGGCSCRAVPERHGAWWLLVAVAVAARRRRRATARSR